MLTLYTTPVVYLYLDRLRAWLSGERVLRPLQTGAPGYSSPKLDPR
jgi:hypothetical protein